MAGAKEIKRRIRSVRDTEKITNAMYLIASAKLRKAKEGLDHTRPYFEAMRGEIKRIFRTAEDVESRYFYPKEGMPELNGTYACLVITADKGLAGAYNQNVIREAERMLVKHPDTKLFVVGEYGRQYFARHGVPVEQSFLYNTAQNPTMQRAREISEILLERYDRGEAEKIYVIYTDIKNGMTEETKTARLLPFHRKTFVTDTEEKAVKEPFEFTPSVREVLEGIIPSYVSGFIYSALIDSFCSEQSARMAAMHLANENAERMISELSVQYNRIRQAAITMEITEVSACAAAQRKKQQKEDKREAETT